MSTAIDTPRSKKRKADDSELLRDVKKKKRKRDRHAELEGPQGRGAAPDTDADDAARRKEKRRMRRKEKERRKAAEQRVDSAQSSLKEEVLVQDSQAQTQQPSRPQPLNTLTVVRASLYVPIPPIALSNAMHGICADTLSPMLLTWNLSLRGVILSYTNAVFGDGASASAVSDDGSALATAVADYGPPFTWVTADFLVFRPAKGAELHGRISIQNENYIGLIVWNLFNATIERRRLPADWRWVEDEDYNDETAQRHGAAAGEVDSDDSDGLRTPPSPPAAKQRAPAQGRFERNGRPVGDALLAFRIRDFEPGFVDDRQDRAFLSLEGTLLDAEREAELEREEREDRERRAGGGRMPVKGVLKKTAVAALWNGEGEDRGRVREEREGSVVVVAERTRKKGR